jgi:hypothetical protein
MSPIGPRLPKLVCSKSAAPGVQRPHLTHSGRQQVTQHAFIPGLAGELVSFLARAALRRGRRYRTDDRGTSCSWPEHAPGRCRRQATKASIQLRCCRVGGCRLRVTIPCRRYFKSRPTAQTERSVPPGGEVKHDAAGGQTGGESRGSGERAGLETRKGEPCWHRARAERVVIGDHRHQHNHHHDAMQG